MTKWGSPNDVLKQLPPVLFGTWGGLGILPPLQPPTITSPLVKAGRVPLAGISISDLFSWYRCNSARWIKCRCYFIQEFVIFISRSFLKYPRKAFFLLIYEYNISMVATSKFVKVKKIFLSELFSAPSTVTKKPRSFLFWRAPWTDFSSLTGLSVQLDRMAILFISVGTLP